MEKMIKAKNVVRPVREPSTLSIRLMDLVEAVNAGMNPGKPIQNWFASHPDAVAAVTIKDGAAAVTNEKVICRGHVDGQKVSDLKVLALKTPEGGVYAEGAATDAVVENAVIYCADEGRGVGGPDTAISAKYGASMTVRNAVIDTTGKSRFCTAAEEYSTLRVYDSILYAHGTPYGDDYAPVTGIMATPPPALEVEGNARTHCTMTNSSSYFYNSKIICDGWGALSTEAAEGFVYLEANDCDVITTRSGYGAYADPDCHDYFNRCNFDVASMAGLIGGEGDMTFTDCNVKCGSYLAVFHNVNGVPEEVGALTVKGGSIESAKETVLIKSDNTIITMDGCQVKSGNGILVHAKINEDPMRTLPGDHPYGNHITMENMDVHGDCLNEDTERAMWIEMKSTVLRGVIQNANLALDVSSRWYATGDSAVTFTKDTRVNQINAPEGVTIQAAGGEAGTYDLQDGGKLVITN
ncbi:MAG: hypothetical protein LUD01_11760 [Clostridiales bacterium]|nr:hypothetical protein [Clostridiales bacterium]